MCHNCYFCIWQKKMGICLQKRRFIIRRTMVRKGNRWTPARTKVVYQ